MESLRKFWKNWCEIIVFLLVICTVFTLFMGIGVLFGHQKCARIEMADLDHNYDWSFWSGCLMETHSGYWIDPFDDDLMIEVIKESQNEHILEIRNQKDATE